MKLVKVNNNDVKYEAIHTLGTLYKNIPSYLIEDVIQLLHKASKIPCRSGDPLCVQTAVISAYRNIIKSLDNSQQNIVLNDICRLINSQNLNIKMEATHVLSSVEKIPSLREISIFLGNWYSPYLKNKQIAAAAKASLRTLSDKVLV